MMDFQQGVIHFRKQKYKLSDLQLIICWMKDWTTHITKRTYLVLLKIDAMNESN